MITKDASRERLKAALLANREQRAQPEPSLRRLPDEGDINDAWWGLCADRLPVTVAALAQRLGISPITMARLAVRYSLPIDLPPGVGKGECR